MRKIVAAVLVLLIVAAAWWYVSPIWTLRAMRDAANSATPGQPGTTPVLNSAPVPNAATR